MINVSVIHSDSKCDNVDVIVPFIGLDTIRYDIFVLLPIGTI